MNFQLAYSQGFLELLFLILNPSYKLVLYRCLMLYFAYKADHQFYRNNSLQNINKKTKFNLEIQQILITFCFFIMYPQVHIILKEFISILFMHLLVQQYPKMLTFCESYALSQYIIEYYQFNGQNMFEYLSELVLMLSILSYILIILIHQIPIKELAFGFTFIAIFKINFFSIYYYLQYRGHSLSILINEIATQEFGTYFFLQFLGLMLVIPISYLNWKKIIQRKLFHFQIFFIILLGTYLNINYTKLALAVFIWFFIVFEGLRQYYRNDIEILNKYSKFLLSFCDKRDSEKLIITQIYLLMGVSHSVFFSVTNKFIGIIILGVGDSFAAIIGSKFGKLKYQNQRSIEGTISFILGCSIANYFLNGNIQLWIIAAAIEAYTAQIDNLILPKIQLNQIVQMIQL
ncbi:unnamed protein product [Paramecium pentaurelia]|uniref:dolichol kinase n=1 Tax=Paramecium pentaurelia TaxID=43138 RepID=A0A8S1SU09_9CILI|nr:unnamed protein product [Paramecium pentaurelia]